MFSRLCLIRHGLSAFLVLNQYLKALDKINFIYLKIHSCETPEDAKSSSIMEQLVCPSQRAGGSWSGLSVLPVTQKYWPVDEWRIALPNLVLVWSLQSRDFIRMLASYLLASFLQHVQAFPTLCLNSCWLAQHGPPKGVKVTKPC